MELPVTRGNRVGKVEVIVMDNEERVLFENRRYTLLEDKFGNYYIDVEEDKRTVWVAPRWRSTRELIRWVLLPCEDNVDTVELAELDTFILGMFSKEEVVLVQLEMV